MRTAYCEWLEQMQLLADKHGIIIQARHHDFLVFHFACKYTVEQSFFEYKNNFLPRWNALTNNGLNTEAYHYL